MSDFIEMFVDMLPVRSELHKSDNQLRNVLDKSVGEYMDNNSDIFDNLFLDSATDGWLDAFGLDYGVLRRDGESDDDYRQRIIFEKLEYLTAHNLQNIYGLTLYNYVQNYDATSNYLTSDNPYLSNKYMAIADTETQNIINKKFVLGDSVTWL